MISFLQKIFRPTFLVVTHNGSFHADDVFACATLYLWAEKNNRRLKVVRTRNQDIIDKADIVFDVGGEYSPDNMRFDHHQSNGAGQRESGIPYASFGLVWKKFGNELCSAGAVKIVDKNLVASIDALDNGIILTNLKKFGFREYSVKDLIEIFNRMKSHGEIDEAFDYIVGFAKIVLSIEIKDAEKKFSDTNEVRLLIKNQNYPDILILEKYFFWRDAANEDIRVKVVLYPNSRGGFSLQSALDDIEDFDTQRFVAPIEWWGLMDKELEKVSGVKGALFCGNRGWFCAAKTKDAAIEMAKKALQVR